ncbi:MAG: DNA alkylation repair protein [bacterium]
MSTAARHKEIVTSLAAAGKHTPYAADANEPDPRYLGYGVRAPQMKTLISGWLPGFRALDDQARVELATALIRSGYGEQKTVALALLNMSLDFFKPDQFGLVDQLVRKQHGWSKIDAYAGSSLRALLARHPQRTLALTSHWSTDHELWLRRASVVLFTRNIARQGSHIDHALGLCEVLKHDPEDMVQKGVRWCLKDHMRFDKPRIVEYVISLRQQGVPATVTSYALRDLPRQERQDILKCRQV